VRKWSNLLKMGSGRICVELVVICGEEMNDCWLNWWRNVWYVMDLVDKRVKICGLGCLAKFRQRNGRFLDNEKWLMKGCIYRRWKSCYDWEEIVSRFWFVTVRILTFSKNRVTIWSNRVTITLSLDFLKFLTVKNIFGWTW